MSPTFCFLEKESWQTVGYLFRANLVVLDLFEDSALLKGGTYYPSPHPLQKKVTDTNMETHLVQIDISCLKMPTNKYYNRSAQEIYTCKIKNSKISGLYNTLLISLTVSECKGTAAINSTTTYHAVNG